MYLVLLTNSLKIKQKLCVNCKFFITPKNGLKDEFGRCAKFPFENTKFLVDGIVREDDFYSCSTARSWETLCGKNAKQYKKKYTRKLSENEK
jgi:hypothetical protein